MHVHPARWLAVVAVGAAIAAPSAVLANTALAPTAQDLGGVKKVTGAALAGRDQMGSYTIERSTGVLPAGQHAVQVQLRLFIPDDSANLYVKASHLTVEQVAA
jgi:hypothetical protein